MANRDKLPTYVWDDDGARCRVYPIAEDARPFVYAENTPYESRIYCVIVYSTGQAYPLSARELAAYSTEGPGRGK